LSNRINEINDSYLDIWEEYRKKDDPTIKDLLAKIPMQYASFHDLSNGILYIGLNPSFSVNGIQSIYKRALEDGSEFSEKYDIKKIIDLFAWPGKTNLKDNQLGDLIKFENAAKKYYKFFAPMRNFAKDHTSDWAHIDVFPIRKTSAHDLNKNFDEHPDFKIDLLKVFYDLVKTLLEETSPKIIVVVNANATRIFQEQWGANIGTLDDNYCSYPLTYHNNKTYLFYVGLTGYGLDRYSKERLFWLMKRIIP